MLGSWALLMAKLQAHVGGCAPACLSACLPRRTWKAQKKACDSVPLSVSLTLGSQADSAVTSPMCTTIQDPKAYFCLRHQNLITVRMR